MPASAGWSRIAALHKSDPQKLTAAAGPTTAAVELAALHLQDAIEGRLAHGHVYIRSASLRAQRAFKVHISSAFSYTCNSVIAAHLLLSTLRPPEPHWAWLLLEALFVAVYSLDVVLKAAYMGWPAYLKKGWHRALVALVCLFAAELAERGARRALGIPGGVLAHLARPLRPASPFAHGAPEVGLRLPRAPRGSCSLPFPGLSGGVFRAWPGGEGPEEPRVGRWR